VTTVYGGAPIKRQIDRLRAGTDIVVATPGRLIDLLERRSLRLDGIEVTVLDEADHMADLGFLPAVTRILDTTPDGGQRMMFSATLDRGVERIALSYLTDPAVHAVTSASSPVEGMDHLVFTVEAAEKVAVTAEIAGRPARTLIFVATRHGADRLVKGLGNVGVRAQAIHGNLSQNARTRNLSAFGDGTATTMVATDIAARGIHVDDVSLVVHADPPVEHKAYLHRSGRTARAGAEGTVVTLMMDAQVSDVRDLTRRAGIKPTITRTQPGDELIARIAPGERTYVEAKDLPAVSAPEVSRSGGGRGNGGGRGRSRGQSSGAQGGGTRGGQGSGRNARRGGSAPSAGAKSSSGRRSGGSTTVYSSTSSHSAAGFSGSRRGR
jgi:superfamily II DNA/RNA helicase